MSHQKEKALGIIEKGIEECKKELSELLEQNTTNNKASIDRKYGVYGLTIANLTIFKEAIEKGESIVKICGNDSDSEDELLSYYFTVMVLVKAGVVLKMDNIGELNISLE